MCPCGCGEMTKIGEDRSERLDYEPAKFTVIETVRPRYACQQVQGRRSGAGVGTGLSGGGRPSTEALLAHVANLEARRSLPALPPVADLRTLGDRGSTARRWRRGWARASFHLRPVVDCLTAALKQSDHLGLDETTIRVLAPGLGRTKTGYMWTLVRDERHWSGTDPAGRRLSLCARPRRQVWRRAYGGLFGDGAARRLLGPQHPARPDRAEGPVTRALCWAHVRRKLKEVYDSSASPIALAGLNRIAKLYAIEKKIRGKPPAERRAIRWEESAPIREHLRCLARRAALARLTALASRREADLYRQPVGRAAGVPARRSCRDRLEPGGKPNPAAEAHRQETRSSPATTRVRKLGPASPR